MCLTRTKNICTNRASASLYRGAHRLASRLDRGVYCLEGRRVIAASMAEISVICSLLFWSGARTGCQSGFSAACIGVQPPQHERTLVPGSCDCRRFRGSPPFALRGVHGFEVVGCSCRRGGNRRRRGAVAARRPSASGLWWNATSFRTSPRRCIQPRAHRKFPSIQVDHPANVSAP